MSGLYSWIKDIVIFMIVVTIITNLLGKSDFKKYVNIVTGMLLVLITISPVLKFLHLSDTFNFKFNSNEFALESKEISREMKYAQDQQRQTIIKKYKEKIAEQVEQILKENDLFLVSCQVFLDEAVDSSSYATLKGLTVRASYVVVEEKETKVEPIQIDKIVLEEKIEKTQTVEFMSPMEIHIKNALSDFYNMDADNINISIQGG